MKNILNQLGQKIKKSRQTAGLTQEDLADQIGITTRYTMAIDNENKQPSLDVLCKIIRTLRIPADNIFYPENEHTEGEIEQLIRNSYQNSPVEVKIPSRCFAQSSMVIEISRSACLFAKSK